jgi:hypothetical protein
MALLTNDQIMELAELAINKSPHLKLFDTFHEWNKKQTGVQVNVDWDKYTKKSQHAAFRLHFIIVKDGLELWSDSKETILIDRPEPVITPHPHAEMIAKYAEVAQRRVDPWVEFQITFDEDDDCWSSCVDELRFLVNGGRRYRHIGETK